MSLLAYPWAAKLRRFLTQRQIPAYVVGGWVRDYLLGRNNGDIDLAVGGDAMAVAWEVAQVLEASYVPLNEVHAMARVVLPDGRHLDFTSLGENIEADLLRRDFTVNAMALALDSEGGEVIDPCSGQQDLKWGLVKVVRDDVFHHDPLRLLRAVRLAAELGFALEEETQALIRRDHHLIAQASPERVRDELCRILAISGAYPFLRYLDQWGILGVILPELALTRGVAQPKEHFWDVFNHSLEAVAAVEALLHEGNLLPEWIKKEVVDLVIWSSAVADHFQEKVSGGRDRRFLLKVAALLHDVAKPQTKTIEVGGRMRFLGHAKEGAVIARSVLERLKFSNREVAMVEKMIYHHLRPGQWSDGDLPTRRAIYRYFRDTEEVGIDILFLNLADHLATRGPRLDFEAWRLHVETVAFVLNSYWEEKSLVSPPKLVSGHDLMAKFGLSPGPIVGELLEAVREAQASGEVATKEEALALAKEKLAGLEESMRAS
ncbi:MAG: CCA tRNA nucleotidyltransferase [Chloroflexi bacterium]|nr:CCA tRNA nucleotidyltransferase [Chloroflexota bacterium]